MRNRRLLFRSYLTLAGGVLVMAVLLDIGFGYLQGRGQPDTDRWLESTLVLIESELAQVPAAERDVLAASLAEAIGVNVQLLPRDAVVNVPEQSTVPLTDSEGATSYLYDAESIDTIIRLGPIAEPANGIVMNLVPPLFYLSILLVVGVWLKPLLRDLDVISGAAQRFAADYREPIATEGQTSELKSLARNLDEMAAKLSSVLRNQKELIAALSHEMRTPLARIRFALAVSGEGADAAVKERLAAMNQDVQEIDELIGSMLNYARLDHPDIKMHWQAVPPGPWLERIAAKTSQDGARIDVATRCALHEVWMDATLMELALSNLLVNALRYADTRISCSIFAEADGFRLSVEDDGPGIPEDAREAVFRAFSRIDDSRSRETGGSGLGLAVVVRVAELHGGRATVDSSPDLGGARFSICWPEQPASVR